MTSARATKKNAVAPAPRQPRRLTAVKTEEEISPEQHLAILRLALQQRMASNQDLDKKIVDHRGEPFSLAAALHIRLNLLLDRVLPDEFNRVAFELAYQDSLLPHLQQSLAALHEPVEPAPTKPKTPARRRR